MEKELLICDLDDTLVGCFRVYQEVPEFLERQAAKRDCIIASIASESVKGTEPLVERYMKESYYGGTKSYMYYEREDGRLVRVPEDAKRKDFAGRIYKSPYGDYVSKDLHFLKRVHRPDDYRELRSVFIGDEGDINSKTASSDPTTPQILIANENWAVRKKIEAALEVLFGGQPAEVFDQIYQGGETVRLFRSGKLEGIGETVTVRIGEIPFRMSKSIKGSLARVVEEVL